jgi:hypothetical protein
MHITDIHSLARRELSTLAQKRYMPHGYNREGNRRAESAHYELGRYLDEVLLKTPNRLLPSPGGNRLNALCAAAAEERRLKDMVARLVELLQAEPGMDQEDANALAEVHQRQASAERLRSMLTTLRETLGNHLPNAEKLEVEFDELHRAIDRLGRDIDRKDDELRQAESRLMP